MISNKKYYAIGTVGRNGNVTIANNSYIFGSVEDTKRYYGEGRNGQILVELTASGAFKTKTELVPYEAPSKDTIEKEEDATDMAAVPGRRRRNRR